MPRNPFSRSSSKQQHSPSGSEREPSSSPPQEKPLHPPSDQGSLSSADESVHTVPLPGRSAPTSETDLPEKKSAWHLIPRIVSRNRSSAQVSTGAGNGSPKRPLTPSPTNDHEIQVHISPPSSPTANPSNGQSHGPKSKTKSRLTSYRREGKPSQPAHKIQAIEGESAASRHKIDTASIDSEFYKIEYGQFKGRPACLIIVDVRLWYPPDNTIDTAKLEFQFGTDGEHNICSEDHGFAQNAKAPISKVFAPELMEGLPTCSKKTTNHDIKPRIQGLGFKIDPGGAGGETTAFKEHRWRVLGRREEHLGIYDTFGWNIYENEASDDSVPRQVRLGMIAFHEHQPFWVNVYIKGSTRQKYRRPKATKEKRWFDPPDPEDVGRHTLQESMVDNLVSKQNLLIRDVAWDRKMEGKTVNLIDVAEFNGGAGIGIDGGEVLTDLLSVGDIYSRADSPTTVMDSSSCN